MPDFTYEYYSYCLDGTNFSTTINGHQVYKTDLYECGWHCDCASFKHRRGLDKNGYCKHIREAVEQSCSYCEFFDGPPDNGKCPKCGGVLGSQAWAV